LAWQQQNSLSDSGKDRAIEQLNQVKQSVGWYFDTKNQQITKHTFSELDFSELNFTELDFTQLECSHDSITLLQNDWPHNAMAMLSLFVKYFLQGQQQALLLNAELGEQCYKNVSKKRSKEVKVKITDQNSFEHFWHDDKRFKAYSNDPYMQFFWSKCPDFQQHKATIEILYKPLFAQLQSEQIKVSDAL
jgi:hypothetical protein